MHPVSRLLDAFGRWVQATNIGAYFAPLFRPMMTEQQRLVFVAPVPDQTGRLRTVLRRLADERSRL